MIGTLTIFDFNKNSGLSGWYVIDDGVMGGLSKGNFYLNSHGNAVFEGFVSLENNGGFSSVHYRFEPKNSKGYSKVVIRAKGDGKQYQLRIKTNASDPYSYISYFTTTGEWQTIEVPLSEMYPSYRGKKLDLPNYPGEAIEEIAFLIGNKRAENFRLEINKIALK